MNRARITLWAAAALLLSGGPAVGQTLHTVRVASGLSRPLYVTHAPGDAHRVFIVEQFSGGVGRIRILNIPAHTLNATPYLSLSVATGNEEGLLGLAFHPDFLNNGYFWIYHTLPGGASNNITRYRANAPYGQSTTADAASATPVLTIPHPVNTNHNGGWIAFGPDGHLYVNTGDGGSGNDPPNNAQNVNELKGKTLRLDVDGADNVPGNGDDDGFPADGTRLYSNPSDNPFFGATAGLDEIYFMGLRNPWRASFDRLTGDMFIGDVGQNVIEEVDYVAAGTPPTPIKNFGWRCMEGNNCTGLTGCTCNATNLTPPIHTYSHTGGHCSVTGGYVYRGCAIAGIDGVYFFADYCSAQIWSFRYHPSTGITEFTNRTADLAPGGGLSIGTITSFGEDEFGELYICDQGGEVFKVVPQAGITDCNGNSREDACDIAAGSSADCDGNSVPDECQSVNPACDVNCDGSVNPFDITPFTDLLGESPPEPCSPCAGDVNGDGSINAFDIQPFVECLGG